MIENDIIKYLFNLYCENKLAHAYLIETDNIDLCYQKILGLVKMINCPNGFKEDCFECNLCHLADNLLLPSLYVVSTDGKTITKDEIETLKNAFIMSPIYTKNNIYIIKEAENMNATAYNRMLKFLEEPNDNILGFFITLNVNNIAPTIYSRLEVIKVRFNEKKSFDDKIISYANEYYKIISEDLNKGIWYNSSVLAKNIEQRNEYIDLFNIILKRSMDNKNYRLAKVISKYIDKLQNNVNIPLLLDSFVIEVGEVFGK